MCYCIIFAFFLVFALNSDLRLIPKSVCVFLETSLIAEVHDSVQKFWVYRSSCVCLSVRLSLGWCLLHATRLTLIYTAFFFLSYYVDFLFGCLKKLFNVVWIFFEILFFIFFGILLLRFSSSAFRILVKGKLYFLWHYFFSFQSLNKFWVWIFFVLFYLFFKIFILKFCASLQFSCSAAMPTNKFIYKTKPKPRHPQSVI